MKTTAEKSSHTTASQQQQSEACPFFAKAGGGDFFSAATTAAPKSIQTKLNVNKPGDRFEKEADLTADRVMGMHATGEKEPEKSQLTRVEPRLQRKENEAGQHDELSGNRSREAAAPAMADVETTLRSKSGGGLAMPQQLRSFMEPRFGTDFANVRLHNDETSHKLNKSLNAKAFTFGNNIFFGSNQYEPTTQQGRHLLAHELTHVLQQSPAAAPQNQQTLQRSHFSETALARPSQTGSTMIQRGLLDGIAAGASAAAGVFDRIVSNVSRAIGAGVATAGQWIQNVAGRVGAGIENAWNFVNTLAGRIGAGLQGSWNFIQGIASHLAQSVTFAWSWIQNIAATLGRGITSAWGWVENLASKLGIRGTAAWGWVQAMAARVGQNISSAWNWVESLASHIGHTVVAGWNWIQQLASRIGQGITNAWGWVQTVATRLGRGIKAAWEWVQQLPALIGESITSAWNRIVAIASQLGMVITRAFAWLRMAAARLKQGLINAWNMALAVAARIGSAIAAAWSFVESIAARLSLVFARAWAAILAIASRLGMAIRAAWKWVTQVAGRLRLAVMQAWKQIVKIAGRMARGLLAAWEWIQSVAARLGRAILSAWKFVQNMAAAIGRAIVWVWNFMVNVASALGRGIAAAFNFLARLAKRLLMSLLEAWDWYLHAPTITIETNLTAPDGSGKSRTKVGVGEKVTFTGSKTGDWKASGGTPAELAGSTSFAWEAPTRAASVKISLTSGKYTRDVMMQVLEPSGIQGKKADNMTFSRGRMGAGMRLRFHYMPKSVSFGNVDSKEVSGPATNVHGYFEGRAGSFHHHDSGDTFLPIQDNNEDSVLDSAGFWGYPSPWRAGGYDWVIPNHFKVRTEGGDGKKFTDVTQAHRIEGTDGSASVTKAGAEAERSPR